MKTIADVITHVRKTNPELSHWAQTIICMQIWGKMYGNAKLDQVYSEGKAIIQSGLSGIFPVIDKKSVDELKDKIV